MRRDRLPLGAALALSAALHAVAGAAIDRLIGPGGGAAGRLTSPPALADLRVTLPRPAPETPKGVPAAALVATAGEEPESGQGDALSGFPHQLYFGANDLDHKPAIIDKIVLVYPEHAPKVTRAEVRLELFIDETGRVAKVLVDAPGVPAILQELARDKFAQARFRPGIRNDRLVKSRLRIEVIFEDRS